MNIKYSELFDKKGRPQIDKSAAEFRLRAAAELCGQKNDLSVPNLLPTHFEDFIKAFPLGDAESDIRFNSLVTRTALERLILPMTDPLSVLYLGSKVVEQSYYNIFRSGNPTKPLRNLSVAKQRGVFFTPGVIASKMVSLLEAHRVSSSLLDPCLGAGALLGEAIIRWRSLPYESFLGIEADQFIASCARLIFERVSVLSGFTGEISPAY